jgi:hypothetical protein
MKKLGTLLALFALTFNAHGAIAYRTLVKNQTVAAGLTINPGATALDVIFSIGANQSSSAITFTHPASFDELAKQATTYDGQTAYVARKKSASGSEGGLTTPDSLSSSTIGAMVSFSGVDNTTPEDVACDVVNNNTGTASPWTIDSGSITPSTAGAKLVAFMFSDTNAASDAVVHSFATTVGTTSAWTVHDASIFSTPYYHMSIASADWTSGSITVRGTGTEAGTTAGRSMVVCVLRPAAAGGSKVPLFVQQHE